MLFYTYTVSTYCVMDGDLNGYDYLERSKVNNNMGNKLLEAIDMFPDLMVFKDRQPTRLTD